MLKKWKGKFWAGKVPVNATDWAVERVLCAAACLSHWACNMDMPLLYPQWPVQALSTISTSPLSIRIWMFAAFPGPPPWLLGYHSLSHISLLECSSFCVHCFPIKLEVLGRRGLILILTFFSFLIPYNVLQSWTQTFWLYVQERFEQSKIRRIFMHQSLERKPKVIKCFSLYPHHPAQCQAHSRSSIIVD